MCPAVRVVPLRVIDTFVPASPDVIVVAKLMPTVERLHRITFIFTHTRLLLLRSSPPERQQR